MKNYKIDLTGANEGVGTVAYLLGGAVFVVGLGITELLKEIKKLKDQNRYLQALSRLIDCDLSLTRLRLEKLESKNEKEEQE